MPATNQDVRSRGANRLSSRLNRDIRTEKKREHRFGQSRVQSFAELALFLSLIELQLWCSHLFPKWLNVALVILAVAVFFRSLIRRKRALYDPKFGTASEWASVLAVSIGVAALLFGGAFWIGFQGADPAFYFLRKGELFTSWAARKLMGILAQQVGLHFFLFPLCSEMLASRKLSLSLAAFLFGLLHLPSFMLAALTFVAAWIWCWLYLRINTMLPLIASHFLLALTAQFACPDAVCNLRAGARALTGLPKVASTQENQTLRVYPLGMDGGVTGQSKPGQPMILEGWAVDNRNACLPRYLLIQTDLWEQQFEWADVSIPNQEHHYGKAELRGCGFRVKCAVIHPHPSKLRVFALSKNGWATELEFHY